MSASTLSSTFLVPRRQQLEDLVPWPRYATRNRPLVGRTQPLYESVSCAAANCSLLARTHVHQDEVGASAVDQLLVVQRALGITSSCGPTWSVPPSGR